MKNIFPNLKAKDIIALLIVGGYIVYAVVYGTVMIPATVMLIVGYYFARRDEPDHTNEPEDPTA